jgi:hypothetical protein
VVNGVVTASEQTGRTLKTSKYVVAFTEYSNTEMRALGEMDVLDGA